MYSIILSDKLVNSISIQFELLCKITKSDHLLYFRILMCTYDEKPQKIFKLPD